MPHGQYPRGVFFLPEGWIDLKGFSRIPRRD